MGNKERESLLEKKVRVFNKIPRQSDRAYDENIQAPSVSRKGECQNQ
jgi:hypothetical protein